LPENDEQLNIKEYAQALELLEIIKKDVEEGDIMSVLIVCERTDGQMQGGCTATQNQYAMAGYMLTWALKRLGFTSFNDVRMMLEGK
jgi:hypothetical protein